MSKATNGMVAEMPKAKTSSKGKAPAKPKPQTKPEIMEAETQVPVQTEQAKEAQEFELTDDFFNEIEWINSTSSTRKARSVLNTELCASVYCKLNNKNNLTNGRITFSKVLNEKLAENTKVKFGALNGKIVLQLNNQEGIEIRKVSKKDDKKMISSNIITQVIVDKYNIDQQGKTPIFKLKDLGNNFYLLDEIIE